MAKSLMWAQASSTYVYVSECYKCKWYGFSCCTCYIQMSRILITNRNLKMQLFEHLDKCRQYKSILLNFFVAQAFIWVITNISFIDAIFSI